MAQFWLVLAVALTVGAIIFGITVLVTGDDRGLRLVEPDARVVPLPTDRPLVEQDLAAARFDVVWRGYRMPEVDAALRRAAYDIGYKDELLRVMEAELAALREGRLPEAEALRRSRQEALAPARSDPGTDHPTRDLEADPAEGPVAEDPVAEGPVAEDPVAEDAVAEDPVAEGLSAGEPSTVGQESGITPEGESSMTGQR